MRIFCYFFLILLLCSCHHIDSKKELENGLRLYEADNLKEAIQAFSKAISVNDTCFTCYLYRGFSYKDLNEYKKAIADFSKLIELDEKNSEGFANRASVYYLQKDYTNSLKDFQSAFNIYTTQAIFYNPICHMLFATGKKEEACNYYLKSKALGDSTFDKSIVEYCKNKNFHQ